jgi:hypothetical protein
MPNLKPTTDTALLKLGIGADQIGWKIATGGVTTFTIPSTKDQPAFSNNLISSATKRQVVTGRIVGYSSDDGLSTWTPWSIELRPGDVVALPAIAGGIQSVTINGIVVFTFAATAFGTVVGIYG